MTPPRNSLTAATEAPPSNAIPWESPDGIAFEGVIVGGGPGAPARMIIPGALTWDDSPHDFAHLIVDQGSGHDGAVTIGRIDSLTRSGGTIHGTGIIDGGSPEGVEAARLVREGIKTGVSVDLDEVAWEVRVKQELVAAADEPIPEDEGAPGPALDADSEGMVTVESRAPNDVVVVITSAVVRGATLARIPAFSNARIRLADPAGRPVPAPVGSVAAAAAPDLPPAGWFDDPKLKEPTGLTITDEGRVFGHLALWGTPHTGFGNERITPPRSTHDYSYFHTGAVMVTTPQGARQLSTGRLTTDTGHAGRDDPALKAMAHYDHTGHAVADVRAGEDQWGIWVAGAIRPSATDAQVRELRASPLSGDWRRIGGNLELVAALAVNVPGFPVPRTAGFVASGHRQSLVAAGMVPQTLGDPERAFLRQLMAERAQDEADTLAMRRRHSADRIRVGQMARARRQKGTR